MSCMTRDTGTERTSFRHAVDEAKSESKTKRLSAALGHLQEYMDVIFHEPSKWKDLKHCHMNHVLGGGGGTYLGQHAKNNISGKIPRSKNGTTESGDASRKNDRNDTYLLLHPPEMNIIKGYLISWRSSPVQPIWEI